ncbi:MAG TPA: GDSL-type esterase/lipase family protein [Marinagarivorans sp.]
MKNHNQHEAGQQRIAPDDARIAIVGRHAVKASGIYFDWAGVEIQFVTNADTVTLLLDGGGADFNIVVGGETVQVLRPKAGAQRHTLVLAEQGAPGVHRVAIQRRNDPHFGTAVFKGILLPEGDELFAPRHRAPHKIEFIGDSYTVGYGNEGTTIECDNLRPYENNAKSFAALTAQALDAQAHFIAVSGRGLVRNYNDKKAVSDEPMPSLYGRTVFNDKKSVWDFTRWHADAVVIKLGTNDFSTKPHPSAEVFQQALRDLLQTVATQYGEIPLFIIADNALPEVVAHYRAVATEPSVPPNPVYFVALPKPAEGQVGCHSHPNVTSHQAMAKVLTAAMREALGW